MMMLTGVILSYLALPCLALPCLSSYSPAFVYFVSYRILAMNNVLYSAALYCPLPLLV